MSYRISQLSPPASTRGTAIRIELLTPPQGPLRRASDLQVVRSWIEHDSDLDDTNRPVRWDLLGGLALAIGVSVVLWTGFGWFIAHVWK
jgi:hypothetical protein